MIRETPIEPRFVVSGSDTETRILQAAAQLFATRGFRASTMRDIANTARIHEVTIYRYFPAKQDLCWRAVDWKMRNATLTESLVRPLTKADTPRKQLGEFFRAALELSKQEPSLARLVYFTGLELDEPERGTIYNIHIKPVIAALLIRLRAWIDCGEVPRLDPETAAVGILGVLLSQLQLRELIGPVLAQNKSIERLSSEYTEFCLSGLQNYRES